MIFRSVASRAEMGAARRAKQKHKKFQIVAIGRTYLTKLEPFSKIIADAITARSARRVFVGQTRPPTEFGRQIEMVDYFISRKVRFQSFGVCGFYITRNTLSKITPYWKII